tara:strand:+ start:650 stop:895 length:246 start_codon:yes stop_codon:yes gene_type:complete
MRTFKFWNETGLEKETEQLSLKKAVKSVQGDYKDQFIGVEYITKKGKQIEQRIKLPYGRKYRQALAQEAKRAAAKKAMEKR